MPRETKIDRVAAENKTRCSMFLTSSCGSFFVQPPCWLGVDSTNPMGHKNQQQTKRKRNIIERIMSRFNREDQDCPELPLTPQKEGNEMFICGKFFYCQSTPNGRQPWWFLTFSWSMKFSHGMILGTASKSDQSVLGDFSLEWVLKPIFVFSLCASIASIPTN